jgi:hypothetical protein
MKLELSLFKFDKNSDYLPYYTKHFLKINGEKNLLDILNTINKEAKLGYTKSENFDLVVNGVYVKASLSTDELVQNFGKELTIEPISIRRAYDDLLIDEKDFENRIHILKDFINEEDKQAYLKLKQYYYASNTLNYKDDYVGDPLLILAYDLIQKNEEAEELILHTLADIEVGAAYYTSLKNRILNFDSAIEDKIHTIQEKLNLREDIEKQNFRINNTLILDFGEFEKDYEIKHDFKDFNIAYYPSNNSEETIDLLNKLEAKNLKLDSLKIDIAKNTFNKNPEITYRTACTILLDAFDNNADFLLVDNIEDFYVFDYNRKAIEKLCGREILIPIIHKNELQKLASGKHKEAKQTLVKHQIDPEII